MGEWLLPEIALCIPVPAPIPPAPDAADPALRIPVPAPPSTAIDGSAPTPAAPATPDPSVGPGPRRALRMLRALAAPSVPGL